MRNETVAKASVFVLILCLSRAWGLNGLSMFLPLPVLFSATQEEPQADQDDVQNPFTA